MFEDLLIDNKHISEYSSALILGTGGGNDITSAILPALHLQSYGLRTDIAGLAPPFVNLRDAKTKELGATTALSGTIERQITPFLTYGEAKVENELYKHLDGANIQSAFYLNPNVGRSQLSNAFTSLAQNYDVVIGLDMGGDVLARGAEDSHILTPMLDFTSLYLLQQTNQPVVLVEIGLLTDGELEPAEVEGVLSHHKHAQMYEGEIDFDTEFEHFAEIYNHVRKKRSGFATVQFLQTMTQTSNVPIRYESHHQVGEDTWTLDHESVLLEKFARKYIVYDPKKIQSDALVDWETPFEQHMTLKTKFPAWRTEGDLLFHTINNCPLMLITPSTRFEEHIRAEIISAAVAYAQSKSVTPVGIFPIDL